MKRFLQALFILLLLSLPAFSATWYVRPDGGTRYSSNITTGQCDGTADVAYPGSGTNQHCAFKDVRYLWQDGSYTTGTAFPGWGWIGTGGDTYIIRGSIGSGVTYRVGWNNNTSSFDTPTNQYWGLQGDPYDSGAPTPPAGSSGAHTVIEGENFAACSAQSARTQLHGGYGTGVVLSMAGASYVDVKCLDITDFSNCGRAGQTNTCNTSVGSLSDYAGTGIYWTRTATNDTLDNVRVHGLAQNGMGGPTGDGVTITHLDLLGNASSGWNADPGDGTTGTGNLSVTYYSIIGNGCAEEYPIVDAMPYGDCTDDNSSGYGDGFGTATVTSNPGWHVTWDQGVVAYNTQDGLDALHVFGNGSSMTITRTLAYGNMGQQTKIGSNTAKEVNNQLYANCNAMRSAIPGFPSGYNTKLTDFCRAADEGVYVAVDDSSTTVFQFNTLYSANSVGIEIKCANSCSNSTAIDFRNNTLVGFLNDTAHGYPGGGSGNPSDLIYNDTIYDIFHAPGTLFTNNFVYNGKETCPYSGASLMYCTDPGLTDETWHLYGYGNIQPSAFTSGVVGKGVTISGVTVDYAGNPRNNPPTVGAYEWLSIPPAVLPPLKFTGFIGFKGITASH